MVTLSGIMPKEQPRRAAKLAVQARIDPDALEGLNKIAKTIQPEPTQSEMINLAVIQYVERNEKQKGKK